jgi:PilZ domain-containing protein
MTPPQQCGIVSCGQPVVATLDGEAFCREHFILVCYKRLDQYNAIRKGPGLDSTGTESVRRFIHECTRASDHIEHTAQNLDNLERAKLLHIILTASELGRHLRRSPRKAAAIPVRLMSDKMGGTWEEETETVLVSRYGALVRCKHPAKAGDTLSLVRADTGAKATARVAWQRPLGEDDVRIGVEFVGCENFWGLDWGAVEDSRERPQP